MEALGSHTGRLLTFIIKDIAKKHLHCSYIASLTFSAFANHVHNDSRSTKVQNYCFAGQIGTPALPHARCE